MPFCISKCHYCNFFSIVNGDDAIKDRLLEAITLDFQSWIQTIYKRKLLSIYFGGGTPSIFGIRRIEKLLKVIYDSNIVISDDIEITLEANPGTIYENDIKSYKILGINRISIGAQSFDDSLLKILSRKHSAKQNVDIVNTIFSLGIDNISIDLMYEIPYQTLEMWKNSLMEAIKLPISHISIYNLVIEPETYFGRIKESLLPTIADENDRLDMYLYATDFLNSHNLQQYEISAFAKKGKSSVHNIGYWKGDDVFALGPSAFSYWQGRRFQNVPNIEKYCEKIFSGKSPVSFEERLEGEEKIAELLMIGLRINCGIDVNDFQKKHGDISDNMWNKIERLQSEKMIDIVDDTILLTKDGRIFHDYVSLELQ